MRKPLHDIFPAPPADLDPQLLDPAAVPVHLGVIMDGNGRWARKRALNRLNGHRAGIEAVRELIRCANDVGVRYVTIYSFSSENWARPVDEVGGLMNLFATTMLAEVEGLHEEGVRVRTIGRLDALPARTREAFERAELRTRDNDGMTLVVAVNYGGRDELVHAASQLVDQALRAERAGREAPVVDAAALERCLHTAGIPDPDLILRTSGEMRLSNFLLWQAAYAEFSCTDVLWPDFTRYDLLRALLDYQGRERRYGAV
ncbi:di-trans,poly-cis-decaprenylcistransferase [Eggerthellaceae bacterium zg-1084]|uniref:Isoprenyl transferase n=1 Tax=Berryella wangjianweii TaxID=2734634 RepID=A0A6M8J5U6_9ACTN|nr:di-trans,poly-cis-decaprenylcistransferase [Berryella wangjianweii]NPD32818.1 di-trans,poly-cis-decaprenylcistransferase [Eggerthellaceae bacterium zg-997]QKF07993.1 di-trans,poly-cis-decaprenylcistransferase [Berryella wangjianweii]